VVETPLNNSNSLIFIDYNQWRDQLSKTGVFPNAVMLSSWEQKEFGFHDIQPLITKLIDLGCKYFVCAGKHSESLHDFIDDVILDMSLSSQQENDSIMTTWHDTDTDDEVADFFLHSTNVSNSLLVAFFDGQKLEDCRLKKAILNLAEQGTPMT